MKVINGVLYGISFQQTDIKGVQTKWISRYGYPRRPYVLRKGTAEHREVDGPAYFRSKVVKSGFCSTAT